MVINTDVYEIRPLPQVKPYYAANSRNESKIQEFESLHYQMGLLQDELISYHGIEENLANITQRLHEALAELKLLKEQNEMRLLEEATRNIFYERATQIKQSRSETNNTDEYDALRADNDLLRAAVLDQKLHIRHLQERLDLLTGVKENSLSNENT